MKTKVVLILVTMALFSNWACKSQQEQTQEEDCFTVNNFEKVFNYVDKQIATSDSTFFVFEEYEVYLDKEQKEISLKKSGYTHSKINKKGVYSLNKSAKSGFPSRVFP